MNEEINSMNPKELIKLTCPVCYYRNYETYRKIGVKEFIRISKDLKIFACPKCGTVIYFE